MGILGLQPEVPQVPQGQVGQILMHEGYAKIALVDLGREVSDALRASWPARGRAEPFLYPFTTSNKKLPGFAVNVSRSSTASSASMPCTSSTRERLNCSILSRTRPLRGSRISSQKNRVRGEAEGFRISATN